MYRIAVLVIVLIVHGSLYPWHFRAPAEPGHAFSALLHAWQPIRGRGLILDAAQNVVFYVPLGLALFFALARRRRAGLSAALTLLGAAVLSASMEMAQFFTPSRNTSATDLSLNVAGAAIGVALAAALRGRLRPVVLHREDVDPAPAALLMGCWIAGQLFPLVPETGRLALLAKSAALLHPGGFALLPAAVTFAEWLAIDRLVNLTATPRHAPRVFLLLLAVLAAKPLMIGRTVTWPELAAVAAVLLLRRPLAAPWCAPVLLTAAVILRGLEPFRFGGARPPFHWVPFEVFIVGNSEMAAAMLLQKIFWYGGIIWLGRAAGLKLWMAAGGLFAVLAAIEAAQLYIPGHVPETTDPLLAILLGLVFLWMRKASGSYSEF